MEGLLSPSSQRWVCAPREQTLLSPAALSQRKILRVAPHQGGALDRGSPSAHSPGAKAKTRRSTDMGIFTELFAWWTGNTIGTRLYTWRKGERVGEDGLGNAYYQERDGERRWVIYSSLAEPSQIPPAWHAWLHHTVDVPPTLEDYRPRPWEQAHRPNLTGTYEAYRPPGSTLRPGATKQPLDYEPWQPK